MSVMVIRYILLLGFVYWVKLRKRCEIDSLLKVGVVIALFPLVLRLPDYVIGGMVELVEDNYRLVSAIYAVVDLLKSALTVLVYFVLYIFTVGENSDLWAVMKRQPKKLWIVLGIFASVGAVLYYVQNVEQAIAVEMAMQSFKEQTDVASALGLLVDTAPKKSLVYGRYLMYAAMMAVVAIDCRGKNTEVV